MKIFSIDHQSLPPSLPPSTLFPLCRNLTESLRGGPGGNDIFAHTTKEGAGGVSKKSGNLFKTAGGGGAGGASAAARACVFVCVYARAHSGA